VCPAVDAPRSVMWTDRLVIRPVWFRLLAMAAAMAWVPLLLLLGRSLAGANSGVGNSNATWSAHRAEIRKLSEEPYHLDRFRAVRGRVTDVDGKPVAGALVRCAKVESLVELAKGGAPTLSNWKVPIEVETSTGADGLYEFAHLAVGARTFFYSAPGRELAPAIKDLIVVQDGLGAQLDVTLARPAKLLVRLKAPAKTAMRLYLVPQRWWPSLETATVPPTWRATEFRLLGGPFRKGLIAAAGPDDASPLKIIGRYDLDRSAEVMLSGTDLPVLRYELPEAAGLEPWRFEPSTEERTFYAAMSPIALFWRDAPFGWPSWLPMPSFLRSALPRLKSAAPAGDGIARGFAQNPFLPVLLESRTAGPRLAWTSEASEFEVGGLPAASYRVRALDLFGHVTFASGVSVHPDYGAAQDVRLWSKLDLDEPDSRQVMGFVKWENGVPVAKAAVFMQNSYNFRNYVRWVETDAQGFFRFLDVPGNEPYVVFAVPPIVENAMRNFEYFGVGLFQREVWRDLTLHPHRVTGSVADLWRTRLGAATREREAVSAAGSETKIAPSVPHANILLHLVRIDVKSEPIVWSFRAEPTGKFTVTNLPHGHYSVRVTQGDGKKVADSLVFDIGDGQTETTVRWPSP
jgi:hypothetical protein